MRSVHFMLAIAFEMSNMKLKVALYWTNVGSLKQPVENCSYLVFGTVDVQWQNPLSNKRISDEDKCLQMSLLSKTRQIIIFNSLNSQQKTSIP